MVTMANPATQINLTKEDVYDTSARLHNRLWNSISSLADNSTTTKNNSISILHHNVKSLQKCFSFYESLQLSNSTDIFSVSETWLKPEIPDSLVNLPDFTIIRCDRKSTTKLRGGGAALYIKSTLQFSILSSMSDKLSTHCDSVWVKLLTQNNAQEIIIASIYIPPDADKIEFISLLSHTLHQKQYINKKIILCGDFNINWNSNSREKNIIEQTLISVGLSQSVSGISFVSHMGRESLLDHIYVNKDLSVQYCKIMTCDRSVSDHYAAYMVVTNCRYASNNERF